MNNNLQLVLKSSTTEMSLNDHDAGIYIVPELNGLTGLPDIRTTSGVNAGYDGGWTSAQKFDARSIVIRGVIANDDKTEVERMRRELVALLAQGKNEQLELDFVTETGRAYEVQVRTIACDMAMQRVLTQQEFMITLRADDPLIYDNSSAGEEATVNVSGATGGFRIPFEIPLAIDAGSEETVVQNSGLESVAPTIKMYGALHNPKIINHTTNQAMQVEAELGFTEGAWTTPVDAPEGTNVSFEPGREAPIESVELKGDTYQQTYAGKNLLALGGSTSEKGLTISRNTTTGALEFGGTTTGTYPWLNNGDCSLPAGTYTFSIDHALPYALYLRLYESSSSYPKTATISAGQTSTTVTTTYTTIYTAMLLGVTSTGTVVANTTVYPQLESGSSVTSFEPYVGGTASPNPYYPQAVKTVTGENVVKITGKNLCNGVNQNYWLNAAANSAGRTTGNSGVGISVLANTDYTISTRVSQARYRAAFVDSLPTSNTGITTYSGQAKDGTSNSITINSGSHGYLIVNATSLTDIQIEIGSSATSFVPYQEQSYKINLGKNLFDKTAQITDGYSYASDGTLASVPTCSVQEAYIKVKPNATYTLHTEATSSQAANFRVYICEYTASKTFIQRDVPNPATSNTNTITTTANTSYVRLCFSTIGIDTLQFEAGPVATTYAAYFTPIELCKIGDYQDYIYKDGTDWKIHKECGVAHLPNDLASVGSNNTSTAGVRRFGIGITNSSNVFRASNANSTYPIFCSMLPAGNRGQTNDKQEVIGYGIDGAGAYRDFSVYIAACNAMTNEQFESWLNSNPLDIAYSLATPTDTIITNAALIEQLEALVDGNAVVYEGKTNIAVTAAEGNMPGITAIRYYTDKEPDQRDELIIDSRLKTITLNGLDVYHLKTEGSEFPMLAPGENKLSLQSDITGDNGYAKVSYKQGYLSI